MIRHIVNRAREEFSSVTENVALSGGLYVTSIVRHLQFVALPHLPAIVRRHDPSIFSNNANIHYFS